MILSIARDGPTAVPLAALKAHLAITLDHEDAGLEAILRAAGDAVEAFLGRLLIARAVEEMRGAGGGWQRLALGPVGAITTVTGVLAEGADFPLAVEAYAIDIDAEGAGWLNVLTPGAAGRVRVRYVAGIAAGQDDVPDAIRHAILRLAGEMHARRDGQDADLPDAVTALLRPWRQTRLA